MMKGPCSSRKRGMSDGVTGVTTTTVGLMDNPRTSWPLSKLRAQKGQQISDLVNFRPCLVWRASEIDSFH